MMASAAAAAAAAAKTRMSRGQNLESLQRIEENLEPLTWGINGGVGFSIDRFYNIIVAVGDAGRDLLLS